MKKHCPKCDSEMEYQEPEEDVGINGGFYCHTCQESHDLELSDFDDE